MSVFLYVEGQGPKYITAKTFDYIHHIGLINPATSVIGVALALLLGKGGL